jgi:hypothetical protein
VEEGAMRRLAQMLYPELLHMNLMRYEPKDVGLAQAVKRAAELGDQPLHQSKYSPQHRVLVWIKDTSAVYKYAGRDPVEVSNYEEIPEEIRNRVAVLHMVKDGDAIAEVGVKHSAHVFYVYL